MKRTPLAGALVVLTLALGACGDDGGTNAESFTTQLEDLCRPLKKDLGKLDAPQTLADAGVVAHEASQLIEDGLIDMRKLAIPKGDASFASDAADLFDNYDDQVNLLDEVVAAAANDDQATADVKIAKFLEVAGEGNDLADALDANRCKFDLLFATGIETPETLPVDTLPPDTLPLDTLPTDTVAPAGDNKLVETLAPNLVPLGDYSFADASPDIIDSFRSLVATSPLLAAQPGSIAAVEVLDSAGTAFARVFLLVVDAPLVTSGSVEEFAPLVAEGQPITPATVAGIDGVRWTSVDGKEFFLANVEDLVIWVIATDPGDLEVSLGDLIESFP